VPDHPLRSVRVGDLLPPSVVGRTATRVLEATALLVPGEAKTHDYVAALTERAADFRDWDGRVVTAEPDGRPMHRLAIIDRYGQVYSVTDADSTAELPDAAALTDWFRFLATACPECGVIDDPIGRGWTP
jgi:hypothetical protein